MEPHHDAGDGLNRSAGALAASLAAVVNTTASTTALSQLLFSAWRPGLCPRSDCRRGRPSHHGSGAAGWYGSLCEFLHQRGGAVLAPFRLPRSYQLLSPRLTTGNSPARSPADGAFDTASELTAVEAVGRITGGRRVKISEFRCHSLAANLPANHFCNLRNRSPLEQSVFVVGLDLLLS